MAETQCVHDCPQGVHDSYPPVHGGPPISVSKQPQKPPPRGPVKQISQGAQARVQERWASAFHVIEHSPGAGGGGGNSCRDTQIHRQVEKALSAGEWRRTEPWAMPCGCSRVQIGLPTEASRSPTLSAAQNSAAAWSPSRISCPLQKTYPLIPATSDLSLTRIQFVHERSEVGRTGACAWPDRAVVALPRLPAAEHVAVLPPPPFAVVRLGAVGSNDRRQTTA